MKLVLVTGMSGAGKSIALKTLEDSGFEAIDNLPLAFLPSVINSGISSKNLAIGSDIRSRDFSIENFIDVISEFKNNPDIDFKILFLDSDDETLRRRFTETRRRHPLALDRTVLDGIHHERSLISKLKEKADLLIDTSETEVADLRNIIISHFAQNERTLSVVLTSFSFKLGIPREADMLFDVRFLRNPHYDSGLRQLTGLDAEVGEYIESDIDFADFFKNMTTLISQLLPRYLEEGKNYLTIAIGCTGGRHRSVYTVQKLGNFLEQAGYNITLRHRDLE
ncbi:MAG: RNase adapter RapZ [Pseudomonadota bacterium]